MIAVPSELDREIAGIIAEITTATLRMLPVRALASVIQIKRPDHSASPSEAGRLFMESLADLITINKQAELQMIGTPAMVRIPVEGEVEPAWVVEALLMVTPLEHGSPPAPQLPGPPEIPTAEVPA